MLFTDGTIATVADLLAYESEIEQVAGISGLDLDVKLELAQTEIGVELLAAAASFRGPAPFGLAQVVVTDALRLWHTFHSLGIVYRDAYNRKLNDKYQLKWNEYRVLAKWAANLYFTLGVGLVAQPIAVPGKAAVSSVSGGSLDEATYFARVAWTDSQGRQGTPSPAVSLTVPAGELLCVSVRSLEKPACAAGWVLYAGLQSGDERQQVPEPLALDADWTMPASGLVAGAPAGEGQPPEFFRPVAHMLNRG
jgi:hypothetical protein